MNLQVTEMEISIKWILTAQSGKSFDSSITIRSRDKARPAAKVNATNQQGEPALGLQRDKISYRQQPPSILQDLHIYHQNQSHLVLSLSTDRPVSRPLN